MARITSFETLTFPVELRPVYVNHIDLEEQTKQIQVNNSRAVVNTESGKVLGVVNKEYKLITNERAVELGKRCWTDLFGANEASNINIFKVDAPSTATYCHIDLVHTNYVMNLWGEDLQSDVYIPYIRVTNSYNTSRALRFDVGFCREICSNGVIFESETVKFKFSHVKQELDDISFVHENAKMEALFDRFVSYARRLKAHNISKGDSFRLILALFGMKKVSEIDFRAKQENKWEYEGLLTVINTKLERYIKESGENAYSLFNAITDLASNPIERNRYFRRDMNSLQRLAGHWMNSFQNEIKKPDFNIVNYLKVLEEDRDKVLHRTNNRYATQTQLFE